MVTKRRTRRIHAGRVFDSRTKTFQNDLSIEIDLVTGLIKRVYPTSEHIALSSDDIDLRNYTLLPGFVDAHTHIFVHSYLETPSMYQERDESLVERILRGTNHARAALKAGYTTYRDLGTEGLGDADIGFRDSINRGIIPGPRMYVATEPLASSGSYEIRHESRLNGTVAPRISDPCDGVDGVQAAVRRRIGAGADVIKFYADYRRRTRRFPPQTWPGSLPIMHPPGQDESPGGAEMAFARNPVSTMWTQEEMNAIVQEAKRAGAPVAAHAINPDSVIMAAQAGVTSIEHNHINDDSSLVAMKEHGVIFVPTLAVLEVEGQAGREVMVGAKKHALSAWKMGVKLACGGDTGAFPHGENLREPELMHEAGIPIEDVLQALTLHGWESCGGDLCGRKFGWIGQGWSADFVAIEGDPEDIRSLRRIHMVMKDGVEC